MKCRGSKALLVGLSLAAMIPFQDTRGQTLKEDRHWIQADDYFISSEPYDRGWIYVWLGKMKRDATGQTKEQALFYRLTDAKDLWTRHFWKSRPAQPSDLTAGALVICFVSNQSGEVFLAPADQRNARTGDWILGRITDVTDPNKGLVRIDQIRCVQEAIRIVVAAAVASPTRPGFQPQQITTPELIMTGERPRPFQPKSTIAGERTMTEQPFLPQSITTGELTMTGTR